MCSKALNKSTKYSPNWQKLISTNIIEFPKFSIERKIKKKNKINKTVNLVNCDVRHNVIYLHTELSGFALAHGKHT